MTEMLYPGLDVVELMILQGVWERRSKSSPEFTPGLPPEQLRQELFERSDPNTHVIEARVYSENPANKFAPSVGVLQFVNFPKENGDIRVDTWV